MGFLFRRIKKKKRGNYCWDYALANNSDFLRFKNEILKADNFENYLHCRKRFTGEILFLEVTKHSTKNVCPRDRTVLFVT